jgi:hypothetical protein
MHMDVAPPELAVFVGRHSQQRGVREHNTHLGCETSHAAVALTYFPRSLSSVAVCGHSNVFLFVSVLLCHFPTLRLTFSRPNYDTSCELTCLRAFQLAPISSPATKGYRGQASSCASSNVLHSLSEETRRLLLAPSGLRSIFPSPTCPSNTSQVKSAERDTALAKSRNKPLAGSKRAACVAGKATRSKETLFDSTAGEHLHI